MTSRCWYYICAVFNKYVNERYFQVPLQMYLTKMLFILTFWRSWLVQPSFYSVQGGIINGNAVLSVVSHRAIRTGNQQHIIPGHLSEPDWRIDVPGNWIWIHYDIYNATDATLYTQWAHSSCQQRTRNCLAVNQPHLGYSSCVRVQVWSSVGHWWNMPEITSDSSLWASIQGVCR